MITTNILYSGSEGNATIISDGNTDIIIDAGGTEKRLLEALKGIGKDLSTVKAIFITHEHGDHTKAIYTLSKKYSVPIYTSIGTAKSICSKKDVCIETRKCVAKHIRTIEANNTYEIDSLLVTPFQIPHDVEAHGFKIEFEDGKNLTYATDTGCVTREMLTNFEGTDIAVIESNHDRDMLINGNYAEFLKQRILSDYGHLSNEVASRFALWLSQRGTKHIFLAHLSKDNNTPTIAKSVTRERLDDNGFSDVELIIADRYESVGLTL